MRKLALAAALIIAPALAAPAFGHCYSVWRFPWPQRCGVASHETRKPDRRYFVEIAAEPSLPKPEPGDMRSPEDIRDFDEHYIQLEKHKDELNRLLTILRIEEDAKRAEGIEDRR